MSVRLAKAIMRGRRGLRRQIRGERTVFGGLEPLEQRLLLTGTHTLLISELLADNTSTLQDEDGDYSDLIEIHNPGGSAVNLLGWSLTDDAGDLQKWQFPDKTIPAGGFLVVFASDKDRDDSESELHTNFRLSNNGEFLALVEPDGVTISHAYTPQFPVQSEDVSYGLQFTGGALIGAGAAVDYLVPSDGSLGLAWTGPGFTPDGSWQQGTTALGFGQSQPGFTVRHIDVNGGNDGLIDTADEALNILNGSYNPLDYNVTVDLTSTVSEIDFAGGAGTFSVNNAYLDGTSNDVLEDFAVRAGATVTIPQGDWTIGFASDDGGLLRLAGVTFSGEVNENGDVSGNDMLKFNAPRGHQWTTGQLTIGPGGLTTTLDALFFERAGGDSFEIAIRSGLHGNLVDAVNWTLLSDGALGWSVTTPGDARIGADVGGDMQGVSGSIYSRIPFNVNNPSALDTLSLQMEYDDGFVAYLNGTKVAERNAPASPQFDSVATAATTGVSDFVVNDFDNVGTTMTFNAVGSGTGPQVRSGGPDGNYLRLIHAGQTNNSNRVAFDNVHSGAASQIIADFDYRAGGAAQPAEGFSFLLLPTATYGFGGIGTGSSYLSEEPNLSGVFGVAFDVYPAGINEVSVHWDGAVIAAGTIPTSAISLITSQFHHVNIHLTYEEGGARLTVVMTPDSLGTPDAPVTVVDDLFIPGLSPYESRVEFSGRTGGTSMSVDLDNVQVEYGTALNANPRQTFDLTAFLGLLQAGENVLAIHGLNVSAADGDFFLLPELTATGGGLVDPDVEQYFPTPTPGTLNENGQAAPTASPTISRQGGTFTGTLNVTLSAAPGATIYYTLNGQIPTESSLVYTGPLSISSSTQLRAAAKEPGKAISTPRSESYVRVAADAQAFTSNLPIVVLENYGAGGIPQNTLQAMAWSIYEPNEMTGRSSILAAADLTTRAGFKVRGSSTAGLPKPSLSIETWGELNEDKDVTPLDLPSESDWILHGPYDFDRALMRNSFIYELSNQIGRYAVRTRFVEVYLNTGGGDLSQADYYGVYALMEKIKQGPDRVDIDKLEPNENSGVDLTGGYMLKIDRADPGDAGFNAAAQALRFVDPKEQEITSAQRTYITNYMNQMYASLSNPDPATGYAQYIDPLSWVDHHILNVLAKNVDALRLSTYMYKDRDGKLEFGPIWDFDRSMESYDGRDDAPNTWNGTGDGTPYFTYPWWNELFQHADFWQLWIDRWQELRRGVMSTQNVHAIIDGMAAQLQEAAPRNFARWTSVPPRSGGFNAEVQHLKDWLQARLEWIDSQFTPSPEFNQDGGLVAPGFEATLQVTGDIPGTIVDTTLFGESGMVRALRPLDGTLGLTWTGGNEPFNDAAWLSGQNGVGYETGSGYGPYIHVAVPSGTTTAYVRAHFNLADPNTVDELVLKVRYDDGFIAYLNGVQVTSANAPGGATWNSTATALHDDGAAVVYQDFNITAFKNSLHSGDNVIAIHALNDNSGSSDMLMQFELVSRTIGDPEPLDIDIYYTTDGTDPRESSTTEQTVLLNAGNPVRVLLPTTANGGDLLGTSWHTLGFNDSSWVAGVSGIGYERSSGYQSYINLNVDSLFRPSGTGSNIGNTLFVRVPFTVTEDPASFSFLTLGMQYDDGFVAYLNGVEVARERVTAGAPAWNSAATSDHPDGEAVAFVGFDISDHLDVLVQGQNILAIYAMNVNLTSSDFLITPQITAGTSEGVFSPTAQLYTGPIEIDRNTQIIARAFNNGTWSGLIDRTFVITDPSPLRITEVQYNPHDATAAELGMVPGAGNDDFEFIEVRNTGAAAINLANMTFSDGVEFTFPNMELAAGAFAVIVENRQAFEARYGVGAATIAGQYTGNLNNTGERIVLLDAAGRVVYDFIYDDGGDWPGRADGEGSSIEAIDTEGDYSDEANWRASYEVGGSPGAAGIGSRRDVVINELLTHTDLPARDAIELHNTTDDPIDISGWRLTDSRGNLAKFIIPMGTVIAGHGFVVFDEEDFNPGGGVGANDFALDGAHGERVLLIAAGAGGVGLGFADEVEFGAAANGESFGLWPGSDGVLYPMITTTLDAANSGPRIGPLLITEVMYQPTDPGMIGVSADDMQFVEIHNPTAGPISLANWEVNGLSFAFNNALPATASIGAGETLVLVPFDPASPMNATKLATFRDHYGIDASIALIGPFNGTLQDNGETIQLLRADAPPVDEPGYYPLLIEDSVDYEAIAPWPTSAAGGGDSLTRLRGDLWGHDAASWIGATPTPGSVTFVPLLPGDLDDDGDVDADDIDTLTAAIDNADPDPRFDLDGDDALTAADMDHLIQVILGTQYGDVNLDKRVNITDLSILATNFGLAGTGWASGDVTGDGSTGIGDLSRLALFFGFDNSGGGAGAGDGDDGANLLAEAAASSSVAPRKVIVSPSAATTGAAATDSGARWSHIASVLNV